MPRLLPRVCAPWSRPRLFPLQAACKRQPDSRAESEPLPLAVRQHPLSARGLECQREGGEDGLWPRRPLRGRLGGPAASAASSHRPRLLARAFSFPRRSAWTGHGHCKAVQLCEDAVVPGGQRLFPPQGPLPSSSVPTTLPGRGPLSPERRPRPRRGTSLSRSVLRERRGPPAGTRGGRRLRPAPAQTEPAAATGRCARAAKAPRGALRRGTMSSLYTRSKEFPRSRRAQPESPPASPSPTAKALRVSGAPLGTCRPWRGSGPGRRLLAGVGEGAQPRPAQRQSAWQRGSGVLVTLPPGAGVGLCSCSRGARGCRPTRSPMRAPRVCVCASVRATAFARLGVRGRQGQLATRAVSLLIPRKRARGAREAAPAAGTSREGRRGRRARGLRVRVGCVCASASGRAGAAPAAGTSGSGPPGGVPRGHRFFPRSRVRRACERLKAAVLPGAVFLGAGPRGAEFGVWPVGRGGVVPGPPGVRCEPSLSQSHLREDRGLRPGAPGDRLCRVGWCRVSWGPTVRSPFPWFSLRSLRLPAGAPCYICPHRDRSPQARTPRGTRQPLPASR